jgi:chromosome partitioning protein
MALWRRKRGSEAARRARGAGSSPGIAGTRGEPEASTSPAPAGGPGTPAASDAFDVIEDRPTAEQAATPVAPQQVQASPEAQGTAATMAGQQVSAPAEPTSPVARSEPPTWPVAPRPLDLPQRTDAPPWQPDAGSRSPTDEEAADAGPEGATEPAPRSTERVVRPLPRVIAVANQKGGVGKTTTTVNLGASLALFGYRVLVVDLDPQGNATTGLGVDGRGFQHSMYDVLLSDTPMVDCIEPVGIENLFVAPATLDLAGVEQELFSALSRELRLKRALATVVDDYDFIFIDCPPSLGLITINAFAAASEILVPVQCEFYALEGLTQLQRIVTLVQRNLNEDLEISTVVLTMYDARTKLSEDVANEVRRHFPTQTQGTVIPRTVRLSEAPSFGQPITTFDPASKGARAYKALAREVSDGAQKRAG